MKFEITQELAQAVLDYLVRKPYGEVVLLISELQKLKVIEDKPPEGKPE